MDRRINSVMAMTIVAVLGLGASVMIIAIASGVKVESPDTASTQTEPR